MDETGKCVLRKASQVQKEHMLYVVSYMWLLASEFQICVFNLEILSKAVKLEREAMGWGEKEIKAAGCRVQIHMKGKRIMGKV